MKPTITIEKKVHLGYKEYETAIRCGLPIPQVFDEYHYFYSSDKGKISLVHFVGDFYPEAPWEIYSLKGNLFEYVERYETKELAEQRIDELL